jgi:N-acetyl-anhydromuramyl-L-alanine amidase AmpD
VPEGIEPRKWRYVVIHHSGTGEGSAAAFDRYHKAVKGFDDLGYHFVVGNGQGSADGEVEVSRRWKEQRVGAHAGVTEYNERGIGICLVGDFERATPTGKQMASLRGLLAFLTKRFNILPSGVARHSDLLPTGCPGADFPWPVVEPDPAAEERARRRPKVLKRW